jgi:glutamyl-tRNA synthetase
MSLRVRVAPSPTGFLHIGVARTALFNYLLAKKEGGNFLLRIEDTDKERSREEYVQSILEGFEWFGTVPDEAPIRQSERTEYYQGLFEQLLESGKAYRCDCSRERLDELRKSQQAEGKNPGYDGHCRDRNDVPLAGSVIRLKTPREGTLSIKDSIYPDREFQLSDIDDLVIAKSDGTPTYQFAVVADDHAQGVNLVLRGNDLHPSTPKQVLIYRALGWEPPRYAHLPMILGSERQKLSKRDGATCLLAYRAMGFLPQAMRNFLIRLGWSYGDEEVFSLEEMIEKFSLEGVSTSPAIFNMEKLVWLNGEHTRRLSVSDLADAWIDHLEHLGGDRTYLQDEPSVDSSSLDREPDLKFLKAPENRRWVEQLVAACQIRSDTLVQLTAHAWPFLCETVEYDEKAVNKNLNEEARVPLEKVRDWVESQPSLDDSQAINDFVHGLAEELNLKLGKVAQPLRVAVTGGTVSPPIDTTLSLLGRDKVLSRIEKALESIVLAPD